MKKILFYCQHILGIGHLVRSMEIARGLGKEFEVCFINGGEVIPGFNIPESVQVINLPAIKTDSNFQELKITDGPWKSLKDVQEARKAQLLNIFSEFQPDAIIVELFPFGRRWFSFELIPLLEQVRLANRSIKVICSLRDILVTKPDQTHQDEKICQTMNRLFDALLIHSDPQLVPLEETFSKVPDLKCEIHYTGYVVQSPPESDDQDVQVLANLQQPKILVSIGGGRFGHELLESVVQAAPLLEKSIPHHIQVFTGPFAPNAVLEKLRSLAVGCSNITIERYTPNLLAFMRQADLSISMGGYNTTMNVLTTGVRAMLLPFTGNQDQEQTLRAQKLEKLGVVAMLHPEDLEPNRLAAKITTYLSTQPTPVNFNLNGVEQTTAILKQALYKPVTAEVLDNSWQYLKATLRRYKQKLVAS